MYFSNLKAVVAMIRLPFPAAMTDRLCHRHIPYTLKKHFLANHFILSISSYTFVHTGVF